MIKIEQIKAALSDPDARSDQLRQLRDLEIRFRRQNYFMRYFLDRVTARMLDQVKVQMSMWAWDTQIEVDLKSTTRDRETATINLIDWGVKFCEKNKRWTFEKKFNDTSGKFYYRLERKYRYPGSDYRITINGAANVDGCEIKQVRRMRKVWETDCKNGGQIMKKKPFSDGSYVAMPKCYWCMKDKGGILLHTRGKDISEIHGKAIDKEPCDECKALMEQGVILISVKDEEEGSENPYRTGGWWVITLEAFNRIFEGLDTDKQRVYFIPDNVCDKIGLKREGVKP